MNIVIVSMADAHSKQIGGKHIHQLLLERAYKEMGHDVYSVYPGKMGFGYRLKNRLGISFSNNAQKFIEYCSMIRTGLAKEIYNLQKLFNEQTVYLTQDTISALAVSDAFKKLDISDDSLEKPRVAITLHGYFTREELNYQDFGSHEDLFSRTAMKWEKDAVEWVDRIITVDTRIKEYTVSELGIAAEKISIQFNAIDHTRFFPLRNDEINRIRSDYEWKDSEKVLLVARRLVKKNGVAQALEAIKLLPEDIDVKLAVAGDGPEKENLLDLTQQYGLDQKVQFLGEITHSDVVRLYQAADIILVPSTKSDNVEEATSLSMLEGMACRKNVIVSAIGGMKEVVKEGDNGFLFQDKVPQALADKICYIINNKKTAEKVAEQAYEFARNYHSFNRHAEIYLENALR